MAAAIIAAVKSKAAAAVPALKAKAIDLAIDRKITEDKTVDFLQKSSARDLVEYFRAGGRDKTRISGWQKLMGGIAIDGIVGMETRNRVEQILGYCVDWATTGKPVAAPVNNAASASPTLLPAVKSAVSPTTPRQATTAPAAKVIERPGQPPLITSGPVKIVAPVDSKQPPQSAATSATPRKPANAAVVLTPKPVVKQAPKPVSKPAAKQAPKAAAKPLAKPAAKPAATTASKLSPQPPLQVYAPTPTPTEKSGPEKAAEDLDSYIRTGGRDVNVIANYQRAIGKLDPDGIVGTNTVTRVTVLLGKKPTWPSPITSTGSWLPPKDTVDACREFADYRMVYKGTKTARIKMYQKAIDVKADGIIGPETKARVKNVSGRDIK
jgi:hypothetical protein